MILAGARDEQDRARLHAEIHRPPPRVRSRDDIVVRPRPMGGMKAATARRLLAEVEEEDVGLGR